MSHHSFHIPVMGTGFTLDSPIKIGHLGISSVISLVDDRLIEEVREYYSKKDGRPFTPIKDNDVDSRARRITAYLNLVQEMVEELTEALRREPIEKGSRIYRYFDLLPDDSEAKLFFRGLPAQGDPKRPAYEAKLRAMVQPGAIDVNIMTKIDGAYSRYPNTAGRVETDAMAALRGFAHSNLSSSIVLSAGLNLRLYGYMAEFDDFLATEGKSAKKKVTLKVSDHRSAWVQAKIFAKKGIWVSEYRIESGLNCGGHAFATEGHLLGPILAEFKNKRDEFVSSIFKIYRAAIAEIKGIHLTQPPPIKITAQGGVGTSAEHNFFLRHFSLSSVGWGSPFLLVPEATTLDDETANRIALSKKGDVVLSDTSPLGIPFYTLKDSASERQRLERISKKHPGSICSNQHLNFNEEFGRPLCTASVEYQGKKISVIKEMKLDLEEEKRQIENVTDKACICRELGDGVRLKYGISHPFLKPAPAVCPGPNIVYFSRLLSLEEMVGHIYGRNNVIGADKHRPHVFINEMELYIEHLKTMIQKTCREASAKERERVRCFKENLLAGARYYQSIISELVEESAAARAEFSRFLSLMTNEIQLLAV